MNKLSAPALATLLAVLLASPDAQAQAVVEEPRWVPLEPEPMRPDDAPRTWTVAPDAEPPAQPAWNPYPPPPPEPPVQQPPWNAPDPRLPRDSAGMVPHVSGGVGASEREELAQVKSSYNLHLLFAVAGSGVYLSDVRVVIENDRGTVVLDTVSRGPFLYARLVPGSYELRVMSAGHAQGRRIAIPASGAISQAFYWSADQTPGAEQF